MDFQSFNLNLISIIILFGLVQIIGLILLFLRNRANKANQIFGLFLLILFIVELESFFIRSGLMEKYPHFLNVAAPFVLLLGPLAYITVKKLLKIPLNTFRSSLSILPFLFYFLYSFAWFLQPTEVKVQTYLSQFTSKPISKVINKTFPTDPLNIQGWVVVEGQALMLLFFGMLCLWKCKKTPKTFPKSNKNWLYFLSCGTLCSGVILILSGGIIEGQRIYSTLLPPYVADLFSTLLIYGISIFILANSYFFKNQQPKYNKAQLPIYLKHHHGKRILQLMEKEKPYLEASFSLVILAQKLGLKRHQLSQILNQELQMNFFELTHTYRIKEAQEILTNSGENYLKIEQLAYALGYKSKSAFFNAFKKQTGTTPAKFKKKLLFERDHQSRG